MPAAHEPVGLDEAVRQGAPVVRAAVGDDADLAGGQPDDGDLLPGGIPGGLDGAAWTAPDSLGHVRARDLRVLPIGVVPEEVAQLGVQRGHVRQRTGRV